MLTYGKYAPNIRIGVNSVNEVNSVEVTFGGKCVERTFADSRLAGAYLQRAEDLLAAHAAGNLTDENAAISF